MDSKHTPGPWVVDGPPDNQIVWSDAEHRICFLAHSAGMNNQRDLANGRLIAASPELVEALKALADAARSACDAKRHPALTEALSDADAALSKAGVTA